MKDRSGAARPRCKLLFSCHGSHNCGFSLWAGSVAFSTEVEIWGEETKDFLEKWIPNKKQFTSPVAGRRARGRGGGGAGDLTGDPIGYVTGVLAVLVHAAYLVLIQKASADTEHGPLTAQYVIAVSATPLLVIFSFASTDSIHAWAFPGWKDPAMVCIFVACILIGCAMNFTTLHCTYINSAVTTSFVGVVKSIATITVGMVAFSDVEPTSLFIAGVVVNTLGSIIYCVAKFLETRKQSNYEDLETQPRGEEAQPGGDQLPFIMEELPAEGGNGGSSRISDSPEEVSKSP
ncbi:solute carrier family 35, member D3-like protein [Camelus ferus]|nr:solute carrier family 35, member D3-like protein [Camelus ferus]